MGKTKYPDLKTYFERQKLIQPPDVPDTQRAMAERCGVTEQTIHRIKIGQPTSYQLAKTIAADVGVNFDSFTILPWRTRTRKKRRKSS